MILGQLNRKQTLDIAMALGKVLLKSGAETSRVEDTIERFCAKNHYPDVNVFVTPTVIVLGDEQPDGYSCVCRIRSRSTNLRTVSEINDFLYNLDKWPLDYEGTMDYFANKLKETPPYNDKLICLASGLASAGFSAMLGGNSHDFIAAFVTGLVAMLVLKLLTSKDSSALQPLNMLAMFVTALTSRLDKSILMQFVYPLKRFAQVGAAAPLVMVAPIVVTTEVMAFLYEYHGAFEAVPL